MKSYKRINWNEPHFDREELDELSQVIESGFVTEWKKSKELEEVIKSFLGVKHVILTTSGTAAIFLAVEADKRMKKIKENYEVIVPNLTFIATATAVELAGGKPILVDIEEDTFGISPLDLKKKITKNTQAIIPVHILGRSAKMGEIMHIAKDNNLTIIEDAANALGSKSNLGNLGTLGRVGCFSLQANKAITCGHGGFVTTNDEDYYEMMVRIKDFGRFKKSEKYHEEVGYNFKFNDILAAVALGQFRKLPNRLLKLINQRKTYEKLLSSLPQVKLPIVNYEVGEIPLYVDIQVSKRDKLKSFLEDHNIWARACWEPLHRNPPYKKQGEDSNFPVTSRVSDKTLWLPNGNKVTEEDIEFICKKIKEFYVDN